MARPPKEGLDYFPFDTGFLQNVKVRKVMRAGGAASVSILISLLCNIYKDKGYYMKWDNDMPFLIADELGVSDGAVQDTVDKAVKAGFFDADTYNKYHVLTSIGIQERYLSAANRRIKVELHKKLLLIDVSDFTNLVYVSNNSVNDDNNRVNGNRSTQSKVNKSKGEENKRDIYSTEPVPASAPEPEKPKEKSMIELPLNNGSMWPVTQTQYKEWCSLFPAVDTLQELKKMFAWLDANKQRRKTARGIKAFCVRWLSSAQDNAGKYRGGNGQYKTSQRRGPMGNFEQRECNKEEIESLYFFANIPSEDTEKEDTEKNETNS